MKTRPKYHFLTVRKNAGGTSFFALPGQSFGRTPVPTGVLVKDKGKASRLASARKKAYEGQVFFTTTLRPGQGVLTAEDIHPLQGYDSLLYSDVEDAYQSYIAL